MYRPMVLIQTLLRFFAGMFDLLGNVWEWTSTPAIKHEDEKKMTTTNAKIAKGGSYLDQAGPGIKTGYQLRISQR